MVSTTVQCIIHPFFAEGDHILHHHWVNPMDGAGSDPTARWLWTQGRGRTWKPPEQWAFNQQTWRKRLVLPWKKAGDFNWKEWTWMEEDGGMGFIWFYFGDLTDLTMIYMGIGIVGFTINHWQFHARTGGLGMAMDHYHDGDVSKNDGEHNMAPLHCCSKQEKNRWRILNIYIYICYFMFCNVFGCPAFLCVRLCGRENFFAEIGILLDGTIWARPIFGAWAVYWLKWPRRKSLGATEPLKMTPSCIAICTKNLQFC